MPAVRNRAGVVALALVMGWSVVAGTRDAVTTRVMPTSALAPADIAVQAVIEPNARNRWVSFVIDSDSYYASSTAPLEGDRAARKKQVTFRMVPAGVYQVRVTLFGQAGELGYADGRVELW